MKVTRNCGAIGAMMAGWMLLVPPFSVTPAGKTFVDTGAPLYRWETLSKHNDDSECMKHRNQMREEIEKAAASNSEPQKGSKPNEKAQAAFAGLRARMGGARCVSSTDSRLRAPSPSPKAR